MNRCDRILHHVDRQGLGIEIGASCQPVAPKAKGFGPTGTRNHCGWMLASQVVEHRADLVEILNHRDKALSDDRALSPAVPDERTCFKNLRERDYLHRTEGCESYLPLGRPVARCPLTRAELLRASEDKLKDPRFDQEPQRRWPKRLLR